jgi:hypothetical protein
VFHISIFHATNYQETAQERTTKFVVLFTENPTKLSLHFYDFSTIFYVFYKIQPKDKHHLRTNFHRDPCTFSHSQISPWFTKNTLERLDFLQCHPWGEGGAVRWNLASLAAPLAGEGG